MAPVEEGVIGWVSGCSSSLQISIVSACFIIMYVTLYSLCASCYSDMRLSGQEKNKIPFPQNKTPGVTELSCRNLNRLEHGHSHGHFSKELISPPSQIPTVSMGTSDPQCVKTLQLPFLPSEPLVYSEPLGLTPSFHHQECRNDTSISDEYMTTTEDLTDHTYSLLDTGLNEENPYECINETPSLLSVRPEGKSSLIMTKPAQLDVKDSGTVLSNPVNNHEMKQPLALTVQSLTNSEPTDVYATVNWQTKTPKNPEAVFDTYVVDDMIDGTEEAVPPIPDKHF
ncbi:membrane progestin receptor beta isoform X2 [Paramisgurnus dabryanus]|uniref:membrane progestin receptor beta isoform X2 n=1 Tax=Paramisgurnus dabryanus TaxID=90735 RepID=UPI0031F3DAAB